MLCLNRRIKFIGLRLLAVGGMLAAVSAVAGYTWEYSEKTTCEFGADVRLRLTHFDRNAISPDWGLLPSSSQGPALEYMRMRERVWACFNFKDIGCFNVRLVNRWQHFSSNIGDNNRRDGTTWRFPDEVIIDQFNFELENFLQTGWSLTLGRQDFILGNGMVVLEGTPYDQGRTIYFDGISARRNWEKDSLTLFAFYSDYKDRFTLLNDQNRRLRRGDTLLAGVDWVHRFSPCLNTDLYYLHVDIDDDRETAAESDASERNHPADENAVLDVFGARVFGSYGPQVSYSFELAKEIGERAESADFSGMMADARLTLTAKEGTPLAPSLLLEFTHFSGDDQSSTDEFEGWHPLFAEYPIWREELLPILFNGNWTNLSQYRTELRLRLYDSEKIGVAFRGAFAYLKADESTTPLVNAPGAGGFGDHMGNLYSAFLDVALKQQNIVVSLEGAEFKPGDYWADGHAAEWLRLQIVYTY
jgi:hypothetical protein